MKVDPANFEQDHVCTQNDAYEAAIKAFIVEPNRDMSFAQFIQQLIPEMRNGEGGFVRAAPARLEDVTNEQWTGIATSFMNIIKWFTPRITGRHRSRLSQIYSLSYIALSKRGQITDSKLERVIEHVKEEIGLDLDINSDQVKSVYRAIGPFHQSRECHECIRCLIQRHCRELIETKLNLNAVLWEWSHIPP